MRNFLIQLKIDPDEFKWEQLAACSNLDTNLFFDKYESNKIIAEQIDNVCLSCTVLKECYFEALKNKDTGVRAGIYFVNGDPDKNKNSHKTQEVINKIAKKIYND